MAERISWDDFLSHPYIKGIPIRKSAENLRADDMKAKLRARKREIKELRQIVETLKEVEEKADEAYRVLQEGSDAQRKEFEDQKSEWVKLLHEKTDLIEMGNKRIDEMEVFVETNFFYRTNSCLSLQSRLPCLRAKERKGNRTFLLNKPGQAQSPESNYLTREGIQQS